MKPDANQGFIREQSDVLLMSSKQIENTEPATEENLALEVDTNPFDENPPKRLSPPHPVIVDGIRGTAAVACFGTYSTRIGLQLEEEHPELGSDFRTKYFTFTEPGVVSWGHEGKSFQIQKILD